MISEERAKSTYRRPENPEKNFRSHGRTEEVSDSRGERRNREDGLQKTGVQCPDVVEIY